MDAKRLVTGTVVGAIVTTLLGFVLYEVVFAGFFDAQTVASVKEAPIWWAGALGALAHTLLLTLIIVWTDTTSAVDGLKLGVLVGFLVWFGADMMLYSIFEVALLPGTLADSVLSAIMYGGAGAAIVAVSPKGEMAAAVG